MGAGRRMVQLLFGHVDTSCRVFSADKGAVSVADIAGPDGNQQAKLVLRKSVVRVGCQTLQRRP